LTRAPAHVTILPPPPFAIPEAAIRPAPARTPGSKQDRVVARLDVSLRRLRGRYAAMAEAVSQWDADRTRIRLVSPLLTALGYRRADQRECATTHGRHARLLQVTSDLVILLESFRAGHALVDSQARPAFERARAHGARWVALTNGSEIRLYTLAPASALENPASALVLRVSLFDWADDSERLDAARLLWLVSKDGAAHGALDAYLAARAVGATLLQAFDDPHSAVLQALTNAVAGTTGLRLSPDVVAGQARLAIRGARGRDGEPSTADLAGVAMARGETQFAPADQGTALLAAAG
jgi:hypothetical protein